VLDVSIVIPLFNEDESLPELTAWIDTVMQKNNLSYEIVAIDDGSTDNSWQVIQNLRTTNPNIRAIKFQRNYGKSAALNEGFKAVKGNVVVTMDADLQDSPEEVPELHKMIMVDNYDLVSGWKAKRYDPLSKTIPTKLFNGVTSRVSGIKLHDFNCGLKAYKNKVVKSIEIFGEMHRYIPVLAKAAGFKNIGEKIVQHQSRKFGVSKFMGWNRFVNGILDLLTVTFITRFGKKPMHFFGLIGLVLFFLGFVITTYMIFAKLFFTDYSLSNKPAFLVSLVTMILGTQFFLAGFLGELISRNSSERNEYLVEQRLD
jgi:glycosyltransferase involved in cell wall biosynthesis